jgi:hypothetical protein
MEKSYHDHIQSRLAEFEMKTPSLQVQDYREELHQGYAKQRALKIASSGLCYSEFSLV